MTFPALLPGRRRALLLVALTALAMVMTGVRSTPARAADVLPLGTPTTLSFPTPATTVDLAVPGRTSERLALDVTEASLVTSTFWGRGVAIDLVRPDGSSYGGGGTISQKGALALPPFDASGTWTLHFHPLSDTTGSFTVVASKPVDTVLAVTPGAPVTVTYPGPGVDVRLTFPASSGKRFTLSVTDSRLTGDGTVGAETVAPDGTRANVPRPLTRGAFYEQDKLLTDGTWTVVLHPSGVTGTQKVTIGVVSDPAGVLSLGTPVTIGTSVPGQNSTYTFAGEEGRPLLAYVDDQKFTVGSAGGSTTDGSGVMIRVSGPDGQDLGQLAVPGQETGNLRELPATGTYTLKVDPVGDTVGSATLTVQYPTVTTTALPTGKSTTSALDRGTVRRWTFTGRAGQRIGVQVRTLTLRSTRTDRAPRVSLRVVRPDGTLLWFAKDPPPFEQEGLTAPGYQEAPPLDQAGTWALELEPEPWVTGSIGFTARVVSGLTGGAVAVEQPSTAKVGTPTQWIRYTFTGTQGLRPTVTVENDAWRTPDRQASGATYTLVRPDGSTFGSFSPNRFPDGSQWGEISRSPNTFDDTGTWTLLVDPSADATGSARITLHTVRDVTGTLTLGKRKTVRVGTRGIDVVYRFTWNGQGSLDWSSNLNGDLALIDPDGNAVGGGRVQEGSTRGTFTGNGTAGTWRIRYDPQAWTGSGYLLLGPTAP